MWLVLVVVRYVHVSYMSNSSWNADCCIGLHTDEGHINTFDSSSVVKIQNALHCAKRSPKQGHQNQTVQVDISHIFLWLVIPWPTLFDVPVKWIQGHRQLSSSWIIYVCIPDMGLLGIISPIIETADMKTIGFGWFICLFLSTFFSWHRWTEEEKVAAQEVGLSSEREE